MVDELMRGTLEEQILPQIENIAEQIDVPSSSSAN